MKGYRKATTFITLGVKQIFWCDRGWLIKGEVCVTSFMNGPFVKMNHYPTRHEYFLLTIGEIVQPWWLGEKCHSAMVD